MNRIRGPPFSPKTQKAQGHSNSPAPPLTRFCHKSFQINSKMLNSIRSTERITEMDRNTIMSLLVKAGDRCKTLLTERIVNVPVTDVEADEIWECAA